MIESAVYTNACIPSFLALCKLIIRTWTLVSTAGFFTSITGWQVAIALGIISQAVLLVKFEDLPWSLLDDLFHCVRRKSSHHQGKTYILNTRLPHGKPEVGECGQMNCSEAYLQKSTPIKHWMKLAVALSLIGISNLSWFCRCPQVCVEDKGRDHAGSQPYVLFFSGRWQKWGRYRKV